MIMAAPFKPGQLNTNENSISWFSRGPGAGRWCLIPVMGLAALNLAPAQEALHSSLAGDAAAEARNLQLQAMCYSLKADALEKKHYHRATVIIAVDSMARSRGKVCLVGPVRMPGPQDIRSGEILALSKAIRRAGASTDFADKHPVKITRQRSNGKGDKVTLTGDVGQIFDKGKTENDVALKPGDLIYIPERMIRF